MSRRRERSTNEDAVKVGIVCSDTSNGVAHHRKIAIARASVWPDGSVSFDSFGPKANFIDVEGFSGATGPSDMTPHLTRVLLCTLCNRNVPLKSENEQRVFTTLVANGVSEIDLAAMVAMI